MSFFNRKVRDVVNTVQVEKVVETEKVVEKIVEVVGKASLTSLYVVHPLVDNLNYDPASYTNYHKKKPGPPQYFHTCEQAHAASDGQPVTKVDFIKIGSKYFRAWGEPVTLPKVSVPKVTK